MGFFDFLGDVGGALTGAAEDALGFLGGTLDDVGGFLDFANTVDQIGDAGTAIGNLFSGDQGFDQVGSSPLPNVPSAPIGGSFVGPVFIPPILPPVPLPGFGSEPEPTFGEGVPEIRGDGFGTLLVLAGFGLVLLAASKGG